MICPVCQRESPSRGGSEAAKPEKATKPDQQGRPPDPRDAVHADRPPAPCPQCGWSVMWNE
jgi:endogenous inhibitor of DNA gyrase (YacG/DUF329 family)